MISNFRDGAEQTAAQSLADGRIRHTGRLPGGCFLFLRRSCMIREKGCASMNGKLEEILSMAKVGELIRKNELTEEKKRNLAICLSVFAAVLAVIAIILVIYKIVTKDDYDEFDDDFDDDFYDDFDEDDFEEDFVKEEKTPAPDGEKE